MAVQRRKHFAKMALSALGFQHQVARSIMKQCFDQLRFNMAQEKLTMLQDKLTLEEGPNIRSLKS